MLTEKHVLHSRFKSCWLLTRQSRKERGQVAFWTRCQRIRDSSRALPLPRDWGKANVLALQWSAVDLARRTAWVHADEAKGGEAIGVPLNDDAIAVLREEKGKHPERVFTYKGKPLGQVNTKS